MRLPFLHTCDAFYLKIILIFISVSVVNSQILGQYLESLMKDLYMYVHYIQALKC